MWYDKTIKTNRPNSKGEQNMSENKETKQEVTNKQILEHLKEIEKSQCAVVNGINTLLSVIGERKKQLKLSRGEMEMIRNGHKALLYIADNMANVSGLNKKD